MKTLSSLFNRKTLVAVALGLATLGVAAQDLRIGFVNLERILRDSSTAKAVSAKLEQDFSKRERDLRASDRQLVGVKGDGLLHAITPARDSAAKCCAIALEPRP